MIVKAEDLRSGQVARFSAGTEFESTRTVRRTRRYVDVVVVWWVEPGTPTTFSNGLKVEVVGAIAPRD